MEVIDKSGDEEIKDDGEKGNGTQDPTDQKTNENELESGGTTNLNGGAEGGDAPKDGQPAEGAAPKEEGGVPAVNEFDPAKFEANMTEKMTEIVNKAVGSIKPKEEPQKQLTDEEWTGLEETTGMGRPAIQYITDLNAALANKIIASIDAKFGSQLAQLGTGSALTALSKENGFKDATTHQKNVSEFLKDMDPRLHNDPNTLKKAVIYSRGLGMSGMINKVRNEGSQNLKIVGAGRPTSPGGTGTGKSTPALNETQRAAAALMDGGEAEYIKFMKTSNGATTIGR